MASAQKSMNVMVTVDDHHRDKLKAVAGRLRSAGMSVADTFAMSGVIVGAVTPSDVAKLRKLEGIKAVEEEPTFFGER